MWQRQYHHDISSGRSLNNGMARNIIKRNRSGALNQYQRSLAYQQQRGVM